MWNVSVRIKTGPFDVYFCSFVIAGDAAVSVGMVAGRASSPQIIVALKIGLLPLAAPCSLLLAPKIRLNTIKSLRKR